MKKRYYLILVIVMTIVAALACYFFIFKSVFPTCAPIPFRCLFDMDIVYTWADGTDQKWWLDKQSYQNPEVSRNDHERWPITSGKPELYYSLKSIYKFFPHFKKVWIVTQRPQIPSFLHEFDSRITVVHHDEIFDEVSIQPTYNSHVIESNLHNIPGLSEHFIYMNDDIILAKPCDPWHFFNVNKFPIYYGSISSSLILLGIGQYPSVWKNTYKYISDKVSIPKIYMPHHGPIAMLKSSIANVQHALHETKKNRFRTSRDLPPIGLAAHVAALENRHFMYTNEPIKHYYSGESALTHKPDAHVVCMNALKDSRSLEILI